MNDQPANLTDRETNQFFEARKKVFPRRIDGSFRRLKWVIMVVTLAIYYVTPWLRWDRGPYAPDQAVLVDLANRRFYMFSIEIWPHEFYYVAGLLIMAAIGLFVVTSAVGRAWCGYACPQTVWTDLFMHIERFVDGGRREQYKLDDAPWGPKKVAKRLTKWTLWLLVAIATGGAWVFYFADAPMLARELFSGTAPQTAYFSIFILTMTTFIFGGFMREQVCIYMCPWPRIQTALMDDQSLQVTYKHWRGEPRTRGIKRAKAMQAEEVDASSLLPPGDCIDCKACIAVCPTGIDIREGPQIGCITCALCIDACDEVMRRIDRPEKLIGYTTVEDEKLAMAGKVPEPPLKRLLRPRTLIYFAIWAGIGLAMLFVLGNRSRLDIDAGQIRNPLAITLSDGDIRNGYVIKLRNMEQRPRDFVVTVEGIEQAELWTDLQSRAEATRQIRFEVPADSVARRTLYLAAPAEGPERSDILFTVTALDDETATASAPTNFNRTGN
ncbi:cytochrome c oxidase accessory protein CcoG [Sphingomicrobium sediminis]|uniref:Cytochrome c oxidase accessory protein CcoG n=1 Tax=Sphingomicrobium sediminis TaxID=2950949 RepID=A0A9X2J2F6_9SPHN|nr:cytochrome c oxidase accessory protein CcoG [Sphingomicrobium sediminis]MCM8558218.1 cytochrome c oxidase accessory protein CcoG [Sphingomicrobium sediminis]